MRTIGESMAGMVGGRGGAWLAIQRHRLEAGQSADIAAPEWCERWQEMYARMFPDTPHPRDCWRCQVDGVALGHVGGALCEVCGGFGRGVTVGIHCGACEGLGQVKAGAYPVGHPHFGLLRTCPRCQGRSVAVGVGLDPALTLRQAHVPERYRDFTVDSFMDQPGLTPAQIDAAVLVGAWADLSDAFPDRNDGRRGVILSGPVGVGKTGLAVGGIADAAKRSGTMPRFASWLGLLSMLRASWKGADGGMSQREIVDTYGGARVLVLDDFGLGGQRRTDAEAELAEELWERRVTRIDSWTLVTTNIGVGARDQSEFWRAVEAECGPRVMSRMRGALVWRPVDGADWRAAGLELAA